jgi:hypothetical protein
MAPRGFLLDLEVRPSGAPDHPQHHQKDHGAERGHHDAPQHTPSDGTTQTAEEQATDQGPDDADNQIADQAEATAFDQDTSEPTGNLIR